MNGKVPPPISKKFPLKIEKYKNYCFLVKILLNFPQEWLEYITKIVSRTNLPRNEDNWFKIDFIIYILNFCLFSLN